MMSADLDWTSALGEAVVADQGEVLEAVQTFRRQAQAAGNLKSDGKQVVKVEQEIIYIEPADPQVIYVPQYNPATIVVAGSYPWGYYPTPYPSYYYPYAPGAALAAGVDLGCRDRRSLERQPLRLLRGREHQRQPQHQHQHRQHLTEAAARPSGRPVAAPRGSRTSNPARSGARLAGPPRPRAWGDARGGGGPGRASAQPTGGAGGGRAQAAGSASIGGAATRAGASGGAMSGYGSASGRQTRMDSSRGASSRGAM